MPNIIKDGAIVNDNYCLVTAIDTLPQADILVTLAVWQVQSGAILAHPFKKGVLLQPEQHPETLIESLNQLDIIALDFPAFADGRAYSYAVLLRQRYGFTGELRATGDVFKDNLFYLKRCGFNSFAVRADKDIHIALQGLSDFSESYQASIDQKQALYHRRWA